MGRASGAATALDTATVDVLRLSAVEQASAVRTGAVSARELVEASLATVERLNPELKAFVALCADRALAEAEAVRPGDPRPLAGVPVGLKDLLSATVDLPTTEGSAPYRRSHTSWLSITTLGPFGMSSAAVKPRPNVGWTPRIGRMSRSR